MRWHPRPLQIDFHSTRLMSLVGFALPLIFCGHIPEHEIEYPMAIVIVGGGG